MYSFWPLTVPGLPKRTFTFLRVSDKEHTVTKINTGEATRPSAVDLVVWGYRDRIVERQADTSFTTIGVMNALARELGLNSAKIKLLEYPEQSLKRDYREGDLPPSR